MNNIVTLTKGWIVRLCGCDVERSNVVKSVVSLYSVDISTVVKSCQFPCMERALYHVLYKRGLPP